MRKPVAIFIFLFCSLLTVRAQSNIQATAQVDSDLLMVGDVGTYMVRILNASYLPDLNAPRIEGVEVSGSASQASYTNIINGTKTIETRLSWQFRPTRPGTFTFPGREITIQGKNFQLPDVSFTAMPMSEEKKSRHFLELQLPEGPFYVGQAISAKVILAIRSDLEVGNIEFPQRVGDAFINTEFSNKPERTKIRHEGRAYSTFQWDIIITPIKSGEQELVFTENLSLQFIDNDDRFPSMFNLSRSRMEPVSLSSESRTLSILEVPQTNRPDSYKDAIGQFTISSNLATSKLTVGEPVTLTLKIDGTGNFDRISAPEFPESDNWRIYPPKTEFYPRSEQKNTGIKQFEYILIPRTETLTETPEIAFSFFNPDNESFETKEIPPQKISVEPSDIPVSAPIFAGNNQEDEGTQIKDSEELRPILPTIGDVSLVGQPFWQTTPFVVINSIGTISLLVSMTMLTLRSRRDRDPLYDKRQSLGKELKAALDSCQNSIKNNDAIAFYDSARLALKLKIARLDKKLSRSDHRSLVIDDLFAILHQHNAPAPLIESLNKLNHEADAAQFAGYRPSQSELEDSSKNLNFIISSTDNLS